MRLIGRFIKRLILQKAPLFCERRSTYIYYRLKKKIYTAFKGKRIFQRTLKHAEAYITSVDYILIIICGLFLFTYMWSHSPHFHMIRIVQNSTFRLYNVINGSGF